MGGEGLLLIILSIVRRFFVTDNIIKLAQCDVEHGRAFGLGDGIFIFCCSWFSANLRYD